MLAEDLHRYRALAGDHVRVVVRGDEGEAAFFGQAPCLLVGLVVSVAVQDHLAAEPRA